MGAMERREAKARKRRVSALHRHLTASQDRTTAQRIREDHTAEVSPLVGHSFGAVVTGWDIREALLDPAAWQTQICRLFEQYGLLVFPQQVLSPSEELAFAKWFPYDEAAPIEERAGPYCDNFIRWKIPRHPEIQVQGWGTIPDGHHGVSGTMRPAVLSHEWHTDGIHELRTPPVYTSMYAVEVPPEGGDTLFASGYEAWDRLDGATKAKMRGRHVMYTQEPHRMSPDGCLALPGEPNVFNGPDQAHHKGVSQQQHRHPLFRRHPATGRLALYVAPMYMAGVDCEVDHEQAADLVARLLRPVVGASAYRHRFSKGDLVVWDNRCMLHSATPMPEGGAKGLRLIHRIRMSSTEVPLGDTGAP